MSPRAWAHAVPLGLALWAIIILSFLAGCQAAQALELGVQDDGRSSTEVLADVDALGGGWTRTIAYVGQAGVADRIRSAHAAGKRIILTVGGTGTRTRKPTIRAALAYISSLPAADRYTVVNEPDLSGMRPCTYLRRWKAIRRVLGARLLYGDLSPHAPLTYTARARRCGRLPAYVGMALHPYQWTDPLAHGPDEGGIGNLAHIRRVMRGLGTRVTFWLTEFGYLQDIAVGRARIVTDGHAARMWPRAIRQAQRNHAVVLIAFTSHGASWDSRLGPQAWCVLTRRCHADPPAAHRQPVQLEEDHETTDDRQEELMSTILEYAA
jgi:hypothetical protein